jgi:ABC-type Fe3+/spermidine/putrescine transport system ATPase subunit
VEGTFGEVPRIPLRQSDRIAIMHDGELHGIGTPNAVYERPSTPHVASFLGESNFLDSGEAVNVLAGEVEICVYLGESIRYFILNSASTLIVREPRREPGRRASIAEN